MSSWRKVACHPHFSARCAVYVYDHMSLAHCNYMVVCCVQEEAQAKCPHDSHSVKRFCALILLWWQMIPQHASLQRQCGDPGSPFCTGVSVPLQKSAWSLLILDSDSIACQEVLCRSISAHSGRLCSLFRLCRWPCVPYYQSTEHLSTAK